MPDEPINATDDEHVLKEAMDVDPDQSTVLDDAEPQGGPEGEPQQTEDKFAHVTDAEGAINELRGQLGDDRTNELITRLRDDRVDAEVGRRLRKDPRVAAVWGGDSQAQQPTVAVSGQPTSQSGQPTDQQPLAEKSKEVELAAYSAALESGDAQQIVAATKMLLDKQAAITREQTVAAVSNVVNPHIQNIQAQQVNQQYDAFVSDGRPELNQQGAKYDKGVDTEFRQLVESGAVRDWSLAHEIVASRRNANAQPKVTKQVALAANQVASTGRSAEPQVKQAETLDEAYDQASVQIRKERGW